jgi:hypothetical protein
MKGGNSSIAKASNMTNNVELERAKIQRELLKNSQQELKIEIMKKKESERQAKIEEKKTKLLEKQTKELGFFSKMLGKLGFRGSAGGEIVRGGLRQLGYDIANAGNDLVSNVTGGLLSGNAILSGAMTGAMVGSAIPFVGTLAGGLIGGLMGLATPFVSKLFEQQGELNKEYIELITNKFRLGDTQAQLQVAGDVKTYQQQKNLLKIVSQDSLTESQLGAFVTTLGSVGINPVELYKQSLKLSKNKESEYYGQNPAVIMDKIATGLTSGQYTKQQRLDFFDKLQKSPMLENLLTSITNINALTEAMLNGNISNNLQYYKDKNINESAVNDAVTYMIRDDVLTSIDNLKEHTEFVTKNVKSLVDYENTLNAVRNKSITSTEQMTRHMKNLNEAMENAGGTIANITKNSDSFFQRTKNAIGSMFD